jgi:translation initiation factor 2 subunit 2
MSSSSSSDEFEELGINMKEFARKRQERLGARRTTAPVQREVWAIGLPKELEYMSLLNHAMEVLERDRDGEGMQVKIPLEVRRESRKTTVNVAVVAEGLNREVEQLVKYITGELGVEGSVNKEGRLVLKGVFIRSEIEDVLRRYIEHFVVCKICSNAHGTEIVKDKKLYFLRCGKCGGGRCIGNIVEGLRARGKVKPQLRGFLWS